MRARSVDGSSVRRTSTGSEDPLLRARTFSAPAGTGTENAL